MGYIYIITNDINNKQYIGKTENTIQERWKRHCQDYKREKNEKRPLYMAMKKYGVEHFHVKELEYVPPEKDLEKREQYWIAYYDTYKNGYNATKGGDGKHYIDYNLIIQEYQQCHNLHEIQRKYGHDPHYISKILKNHGIEVLNVIQSDILRGKPVNQYTLDNKFLKTFSSSKSAYNTLFPNKQDKGYGHILEVCNYKRKSAYGYIWRFANEDI